MGGYKIKFGLILFVFTLAGVGKLFALNQNDLKIVSRGEDIRYLSQKMANDYLYLFFTRDEKYREKIGTSVEKIEDDLRLMAKSTDDDDVKNVLDFLSYGKDQIKKSLMREVSKERVSDILEYCDTLVEGVESILQERGYATVNGLMRYYILRLSKLYMAVHLKFEPSENTKLLYETKQKLENIIKKSSNTAVISWNSYKDLINTNPIYFIPKLLSVMIWDLERSIG